VARVVVDGTNTHIADLVAVSPGSATVRAIASADTTKFAEARITVSPATIALVTITPPTADVIKGQTVSLAAGATTARGVRVTDRPVAWTTSNSTVATVSTQGIVTGVALGTATITATIEGVSGTASLSVRTGAVAQVVITPPSPQISRGGTLRLTVLASDAFGNGVDLAGKTVTWTSNSPAVATVTDGLVTGVAAGQATITATVDGKAGSETVRVVEAPPASIEIVAGVSSVEEGKTLPLQVVVRDAAGNPLSLSTAWRSLDTQIATVSAAGVVTGVTAGATPARIIVSVPASATTLLADTSLITVTPTAVASVDVGLATGSIEVGEQTAATATLHSESGQVLTGRTVTWASSAPNVASVSASGVVIGVGPGSATITALREGKIGSASLQVLAPAPDRIELSPATASIALGSTQMLTPVVRDKRGGVVTGCAITWTTSNPSVATVTAGVVTGVAPGSATITAHCLTKQATAAITVTQGPALSITGVFLYGTSTLANLANLSGMVEVVAEYAFAGQTPTTLELLVDGQVVRSLSVTTSGGCSSVCRLPLNTSYVNGNTGPVSILNGSRTISVRLSFQGAAALLASTAAVFNNPDEFVADQIMSPSGGFTNDRREQWYGGPNGSATVTLAPLIHTPGRVVTSVSVKLGSGPTLTDGSAPFSVVFNATTYTAYSSQLAGDQPMIVGSTYSDGSRGPSAFAVGSRVFPIRVDFAPPTPPTVPSMPVWLNAQYYFLMGVTQGQDAGVGMGATVPFAGVTTGTLPADGVPCADGLTVVATASQLSPDKTYRGRVVSTDVLGNRSCTDVRPGGISGGTFKVDFVAPTLTMAAGPQRDGLIASEPTPDFVLAVSDNESGLGPNPVRVTLQKWVAGGASTCLIGSPPNCGASAQPTTFPSNDGSNGYYHVTFVAVDQAGNSSGSGAFNYIIDNAAPVVSLVSVPSSLTVRDSATVSFSATDNIGLVWAFPAISYGSIALRTQTTLSLSPGFGPQFVGSARGDFTLTLPARCITSQPPSGISVTVQDQARLSGSATHAIAPNQLESCGLVGNATFSSFGISPAPASVSRSFGTTTLTVDVNVPPDNVVSPFSRVLFYQADGGVYQPIGAGAISMVQYGNDRRWYYKLVWDPYENTVPIGNVTVLALLVDEDGDALSVTTTVNVTP
jgi:uncharacterized protein YjdB